MAITAGSTLLQYRLVEKIGEGGMGEVWRAVDTSLDRDVAIKILPEAFAADAERMARFEREAKAVAALADPHILSIHGFGREGALAYAVTELLDGETLRARLAGGPLPARKVVDLGQQIAQGLGAAHSKGFVHRDLKPENIFVTRSGSAKILDFGLAALATPPSIPSEATHAPTRVNVTTPGSVMGTPAYMSPEQVRGDPVDPRSDLFSLGAVLYEALTGTIAFRRGTSAETMTAVLREDPRETSDSGIAIPPALDRVIRRCLEKRPEERFQSARDLAFALGNALEAPGASGTQHTAPRAEPVREPARRGLSWVLVIAVAAVAAVLGAIGGASLRVPAPADPPRVHTLTFSGSDTSPSPSPDGRMIAFVSKRDGRTRIWIKQLAGGGEQPLTEGPDNLPRFSPDGSSVLFLRDLGDRLAVFRQALVGGQARKIVDDATEAAWSPDGSRVAFVRVVSGTGGRPADFALGIADAQDGSGERLVTRAPYRLFCVSWSLDGTRLVVMKTAFTGNTQDFGMAFVPIEGGNLEALDIGRTTSPLTPFIWAGKGDVIFARAGSLLGDQGNTLSRVVRVNPQTGVERTLFYAEHVFPNLGNTTVGSRMEILGPGSLLYESSAVRENLHEIPLPEGSRAAKSLTRGEGRDRQPVYSPDGSHVLFSSNRSGNLNLWILNLKDGSFQQITDDLAQDWDPAFTPDGKGVLWSSDRSGHLEIWSARVDGSGARQVTNDGRDAENPSMTPDGKWIVYWSANPERQGVWKVHPDGSEDKQLVSGPYIQSEVSPDGRWAAYVSLQEQNLRSEVRFVNVETGAVAPMTIVTPMPNGSREGVIYGRTRWLDGGREIAYVGLDATGRAVIFAQPFDPEKDTSAQRRPLGGLTTPFITESFGISPDGRSLIIAGIEMSQRIMLAEGVAGVEPGHP